MRRLRGLILVHLPHYDGGGAHLPLHAPLHLVVQRAGLIDAHVLGVLEEDLCELEGNQYQVY